jgi:IS30 family transposase
LRFVIFVKVADKENDVVVAALIKAVRKLTIALRRSLTWDRGAELANHAQLTAAIVWTTIHGKRSSPLRKSRRLNVTIGASPTATANSNTRLSPSSGKFGLQR